MTNYQGLQRQRCPDWRGLVDNILRKKTPERVFFIELFHDHEMVDKLVERFDLTAGLDRGKPDFDRRRYLAFQRFCGLDFVRVRLKGVDIQRHQLVTEDTGENKRATGRTYQDEHAGPIMSWVDFEAFQWPDPDHSEAVSDLEWWQANLPEDMCIMPQTFGHFCEWLVWLMGYEKLCIALHEQRDLVKAISEKIIEINRTCLKHFLEFDRVGIIWAGDDMGFKTGTLLSPEDMREFVLPGHRQMAEMSHRAGRVYLLHSCGKLSLLMDDLINKVRIDGKHSFEDTIEDVRDAKRTYGQQIALLGGIDVDFLCRSHPDAIRQRVRETLAVCQEGGGYCLGTGNSVANYIPLDNYLAMLDEGFLWKE